MAGEVHSIAHPLIQHKLSLMRRKSTSTSNFRALLQEIAMLLGYEVTRDLPLEKREIETPLMKMQAPFLAGKKVVLISVLRAGNGLLDGMTKIIPSARVGHVGMYRDPKTLEPVEYYFRAPSDMADRQVIVVDPMLATGNSAAAAVERVKKAGAEHIKFACLLAAPEGIEVFHRHHPDVPVFTAAIDECLNEKGYILPGLGDAGDRLFGTK
ncbi:MAG: uracil phosphoribosyltransferase [Myxococcales bacterium]|nr:uracil phosphoribosyltransferase [Myxococcales bacterium]MCB9716406.1 uracil phosphoribosyltransferase [Myxococcales bacterium]